MPKIGLLPSLLVIGAIVAAVGSYSALAGPGPVDLATSVTGSDDADDGDVQAPDGDEDGATGNGEEKIAQAIADEFEVTQEEVLALHDEGIGFGALFKLYQLAKAQDMTVDELLATLPTGDDGQPEFGFGQLRKGLTEDEQAILEDGPKNLGELVSAASKNHGESEDGEEAAQVTQASGGSHGHGNK